MFLSDRDYTQGLGVMVFTPRSACLPLVGAVTAMDEVFDSVLLGWFAGAPSAWTPVRSINVTFAQHMYTPDDISIPVPDPADRPYAGWLYASLGYVGEMETEGTWLGLDSTVRHVSLTQIDFGVIGPMSGAGWTQRWWHDDVNEKRNWVHPAGWGYQLDNEPGLILRHERTIARQVDFGPIDVEASANVGMSLGNVMTDAQAGAGLRIGRDLSVDYGPPRLRPAPAWPNRMRRGRDPVNAYLFGYVAGRAIARNIFLDGNTFADSRRVDKHHFVWEYQAGVAIFPFRWWRLTFTRVGKSEEFFGQSRDAIFHSVSTSFRF